MPTASINVMEEGASLSFQTTQRRVMMEEKNRKIEQDKGLCLYQTSPLPLLYIFSPNVHVIIR